MSRSDLSTFASSPALVRLSRLASLDEPAVAAIEGAIAQAQPCRNRRELVAEGDPIVGAKLIVRGWAARVRMLADGRRQFLSFLLPGDLVGLCRQPRPIAASTVVALTDLVVCTAPSAAVSPALEEAYAVSHALEEAYLLAHITRLGRLTAQERIGDQMLELLERLELAGIAVNDGFDMPLTQEMLADALGLTPVHVNRMLQLARREGDLHWRNGRLTLPDRVTLADKVGRAPIRVSSVAPRQPEAEVAERSVGRRHFASF